MEPSTNNTKEAFMEIIANKIDRQEKKQADLEGKINELIESKILLAQVNDSLAEGKAAITESGLVIDSLELIADRLQTNNLLLHQTAKNKVQHHHHFPKLLWITAGLFFTVALVLAGWYVTGQKIEGLLANDTKYRYLKLDTSQKYLQLYIYKMDSLYTSIPDMRKHVFDQEKRNQENFEKLQKADALKAEARYLEQSIKAK